MPFQVQLLVTSQDVENYKQIKSDLDQLRSIVEKSELWVYKRQGSDEGMDAGETLSAESEHKMVQYTVHQKLFDVVYEWFYQSKAWCSNTLRLMFSLGGFRGYRQAKESRKYQQLQLQGGKRGTDCIYYLNSITKLKDLVSQTSPPHISFFFCLLFIRSCCGSANCVFKKVCQVGRAGSSSRGC